MIESLPKGVSPVRQFVEQASVKLALFNRDMRYVATSAHWLADSGPERSHLIGSCHYDVFPGNPERWRRAHRRALEGAVLRCEEEQITRLDGRVEWVRWEVQPWRDATTAIGGIILFTEDITKRKQTEAGLRESNRFYRSLYDDHPSMLFTVAADGALLSANRAVSERLGYVSNEIIGAPLWRLCQTAARSDVRASIEACLHSSGAIRRLAFVLIAKDGYQLRVEATARLITAPGGTATLLVACDEVPQARPGPLATHVIGSRNGVSSPAIHGGHNQRTTAVEPTLTELVGDSQPMLALKRKLRSCIAAESRLKDCNAPSALITGETGTGKELVARALHFEGARASKPFITINCAAIPDHLIESELFGFARGAFSGARTDKPGLTEAAVGGTLFMDEIDAVPVELQAKLLRLLEDKRIRRLGAVDDRKIDVRIVAASNQKLYTCVDDGSFRADLYFRLRTIHLEVPPLRDRGADVLHLAGVFLRTHGERYQKSGLRFSAHAERAIIAHSWHGNVRELKNSVEQAVLLAETDTVDGSHLGLAPPVDGVERIGVASGLKTLPKDGVNLEQLERKLVAQSLDRSGGNVTRAAKLLGLSRDALRYRIEKHGLREPSCRRSRTGT